MTNLSLWLRPLTRVALNGVEMTEGASNAAIAGNFNVPLVMMSGDDAAIAEVRSVIGNIEGAETKKSLGFHSAITLTPQASIDMIGRTGDEASSHRSRRYRVLGTPVPT